MPSIDSFPPLAARIRTQACALRKTDRHAIQSSERKQRPSTESDLTHTLATKIAAIDTEDPQREHKAFGLFLEAILIAEFGDALLNDPAFYRMAEKIQEQMAADQEMAQHMRMAAQTLLERAAQASPEKR